jgi:hypothetical protein
VRGRESGWQQADLNERAINEEEVGNGRADFSADKPSGRKKEGDSKSKSLMPVRTPGATLATTWMGICLLLATNNGSATYAPEALGGPTAA